MDEARIAARTTIKLAVAFVLSVALTALLALIIGVTWDDASAAERASHEPIGIGLFGSLFSAIVLRRDRRHRRDGRIRLGHDPPDADGDAAARARARREGAVVASLTLVAGLVTAIATFLVAQLDPRLLRRADREPRRAADALRVVFGDGVLTPVLPVIAVALGFATRSTAGAVTSVLAVVFTPWILAGVLPAWWQDNVLGYVPGAASDAITIGHLEGSTATLAPGVAALVVLGWLVVFLGAGWLALERRDA